MPIPIITPLSIPDVMLIATRRFEDRRGHFIETYSLAAFAAAGIDAVFVQDNESLSVARGTVRGLHFQRPPHAQAKLVRVLRGAVLDVIVDIRRNSGSYGQSCVVTLTAQSDQQLFVPRGFAHGFCTLEPDTVVAYKVDNEYAPQAEAGVLWNDSDLALPWPVGPDDVIVSDKDAALPRFAALESPFVA